MSIIGIEVRRAVADKLIFWAFRLDPRRFAEDPGEPAVIRSMDEFFATYGLEDER
jgi:hypothetical protein